MFFYRKATAMAIEIEIITEDDTKLFEQLKVLLMISDARRLLLNTGYNPEMLQLGSADEQRSPEWCAILSGVYKIPAKITNVQYHGSGYNFTLILDEVTHQQLNTLGLTKMWPGQQFESMIRTRFQLNVSTDEDSMGPLMAELAGDITFFGI
jgi:hypothetical protein